jgi:glycine oxidase
MAAASRTGNSPDVVVVGGGVIGLACAWRASQRGLEVRVLERDEPGAGASHVAAGMLAPVGEASWNELALLKLNLASAHRYADFVSELERVSGEDVGYARCGALHVALDRDEAEELRRRHRLQDSLGLQARWLPPAGCRELEPGLAPRVAGGVHVLDEARIDPRALIRALKAALRRQGVEVLSGTEVCEAVVEGDRLAGVLTTDGALHAAGHFVLAAGCWSAAPWLPVSARPPVRPVKGQILLLRGEAEAVCEGIVVTERVYLVPRPGGSLVVGATVEERGFDTTVTAGGVHELLREAYRALPDVAELELVETRAGLRPGTPDNAPLIGAGALQGLVLATGHFRNGILLAPVTADAVAALVCGDQPDPVVLPVAPGRFEIGATRPREVALP